MQMNTSWLLTATVFLRIGEACMNNTEHFGTLDSSLEITGSTLLSSATSCHCCGLCHQNAACKSFSFGLDNKECTLYSKVGSYGEFSRQSQGEHNTQFFFMPKRSSTNEFCRSDSDCVTSGDSCRGRICTTDTIVTCRDIYEQNNALPDHRYWGFIDGRELRLYCRMENDFNGATMLLAFQHPPTEEVLWSEANRLNKTFYKLDEYPDEKTDFSILMYADAIRDSRDSQKYEVRIIATKYAGYGEMLQTFTASKTLSLIDYQRVMLPGGLFTAVPEVQYDDRYLTFPHLTTGCETLYSTGNYECNNRRSLMKTTGMPWWPTGTQQRETIVLYITE